ncbi:30S ribosomal protein S15 [Buchnera aphidicola (Kurisakia onigurumii)]|uniref:30S ribosomal protein S15 n=1 Tax=Buchnera aphidicola TaxID=9 RepID=UPI0031B71D6C
MNIHLLDKKTIILQFSKNKKNSGKTTVQIALLTHKINILQKHFSIHKKDFGSRMGLLKMVSKRRKLLNYLKNKNLLQYSHILKKLKLRH